MAWWHLQLPLRPGQVAKCWEGDMGSSRFKSQQGGQNNVTYVGHVAALKLRPNLQIEPGVS